MLNARRLVVAIGTVCASVGVLGLASVPAFAAAPVVTEESFSSVSSTEATVSAQAEAGGESTSYRVEYGTSVAYGTSTVEGSLPAAGGVVGVRQRLTGLQSGTAYHFRFVASNATTSVNGVDVTFTTSASSGPSSSILPDGRVYEQVSVPDGGEVYVPNQPSEHGEKDIPTELPFRPSNDGDNFVYLAEPPRSGESGNGSQGSDAGNEYLAKRSSDGWGASDITPSGTQLSTAYQVFSGDLSMGVIAAIDKLPEFPPLTSEVSASPLMQGCQVLYARANGDGVYRALFTATQAPGCGEPRVTGANEGSASVAAYTHVLFQTRASLAEGVEASSGEGDNLYDSVDGRLYLVNVLPDGSLDQEAVFGGLEEEGVPDFSGVISGDGSRVFWSDLSSHLIYARENDTQPQSPMGAKGECTVPSDACTVQISTGAATYWTAGREGRFVFYTEAGQLWRFDLQSETREPLTSTGAEVQGVIGVNETGEEGAYVYFVADGVLNKAANVEGKEPVEGEPNLYLYRPGQAAPTFVATLSPSDNEVRTGGILYGDWRADVGHRYAELTPDGHTVTFVSTQPLTGYDNMEERRQENNPARPAPEVFVYDADTGRISCASCAPDGERPVEELVGSKTGVPVSSQPTYMTRWISDNGGRVFFTSPQPLVPQDVAQHQDVYEWERNGEGSCHQTSNCVYLLSGGESEGYSYIVGASANGDDVFFTHRGALVPQAADGEEMVLYDARVDGGFPETSLACTGTGCQGVPPAPPIFATPSSVTFNGVGNFAPPVSQVSKPRSRSRTVKCKKGYVRKHTKCIRAKKKGKRSTARRAGVKKGGRS